MNCRHCNESSSSELCLIWFRNRSLGRRNNRRRCRMRCAMIGFLCLLMFGFGAAPSSRGGDKPASSAKKADKKPVDLERAQSDDVGKPAAKATLEVAKELSTVQGVTIKRYSGPAPSALRPGVLSFHQTYWGSPNWFKTVTLSLAASLEKASGLPPTRIQGVANLADGIFDIEARNDDAAKDVHLMVYEAIGKAFNLRVSVKRQETEVLVLATTKRWPQDGFKVSKRDTGHWTSLPLPLPDGGRVWTYEFTGVDMEGMARWLESTTEIPVVNETKLQGRFEGEYSFTYREPNMLPKLQKTLARHGLSLTRATRSIEVLVIEPIKKKPADKTNTMFPDGTEHDFGKVLKGTLLKHTFRIVNTGNVPLRVVEVRRS